MGFVTRRGRVGFFFLTLYFGCTFVFNPEAQGRQRRTEVINFAPFFMFIFFFSSDFLPFYLPSFFPVLYPDLCNSYLGYLSRWKIPEVRGGRGREKSQKKYSCSDRILILYAWIELFNFFLLHIFLVLRLLFPRTSSSWF